MASYRAIGTVVELATPTYARVGDRLRKDILSGKFPPGARLKIADLSKAYGVSQMPIREALQQLQGEGLLEILPNRGASVRQIDEHMVINIYDLRGAIESMLVARCAAIITDDQLVQLYEIEARYESAVALHDPEESMEANRALHQLINSVGDNPEAQQTVEKYSDLLSGLRWRYGFRAGRSAQTITEHRELLRALAAHDVVTASQITMEHCRHAKEDLLALLRGEGPAE